MKTSELTGAQLDYWVAQVDGLNPSFVGKMCINNLSLGEREIARYVWYSPSSNWADGGPLIEKHRLYVEYFGDNNREWMAARGRGASVDMFEFGATPLEAVCRFVVRAKFGDEVPT